MADFRLDRPYESKEAGVKLGFNHWMSGLPISTADIADLIISCGQSPSKKFPSFVDSIAVVPNKIVVAAIHDCSFEILQSEFEVNSLPFLRSSTRIPVLHTSQIDSKCIYQDVDCMNSLLLWPDAIKIDKWIPQSQLGVATPELFRTNSLYFQIVSICWNDMVVFTPGIDAGEDIEKLISSFPDVQQSSFRAMNLPIQKTDCCGRLRKSKSGETGLYLLRQSSLDHHKLIMIWYKQEINTSFGDSQVTSQHISEPMFRSSEVASFKGQEIPVVTLTLCFGHPVSVELTELIHTNEMSNQEKASDAYSTELSEISVIDDSHLNDIHCVIDRIHKIASSISRETWKSAMLEFSVQSMCGHPAIADFDGAQSVFNSACKDNNCTTPQFKKPRLNDSVPQQQHIHFYELEEGEELEDIHSFKPPPPSVPKPTSAGPIKSFSDQTSASAAYLSLAAAYVAAHQSYIQGRGTELHTIVSDYNTPLSLCAIDCEMCETANGLELTRFSLVSIPHGVLIDTLVQPPAPIINYWTEFSGINENALNGVTTTLADIHALLRNYNIISPDTIVVGHSIDSDLRAARLIHEFVVDTSILFHHDKGYPHKHSLKYLSQKYLGKGIQVGDRGHNSIEDAITTMELAVWCLSNNEVVSSSWVRSEKLNLLSSVFSTPRVDNTYEVSNSSSAEAVVNEDKFEFAVFSSDSSVDYNKSTLIPSGRYASGYKPESNAYFAIEYARLLSAKNIVSTESIFRCICSKTSMDSLLQCQHYWKSEIQSINEEKKVLMYLDLRLDSPQLNSKESLIGNDKIKFLDIDYQLGLIFENLPSKSILIVITQGKCEDLKKELIRKQRIKWELGNCNSNRSVANIKKLRDWYTTDENNMIGLALQAMRGMAFMRVKQ